jgi:hypothetical protein
MIILSANEGRQWMPSGWPGAVGSSHCRLSWSHSHHHNIDIDIDIGIVVVEVYRKGLNTTAFSRCRFSIFSEESKRKFPKKPVP